MAAPMPLLASDSAKEPAGDVEIKGVQGRGGVAGVSGERRHLEGGAFLDLDGGHGGVLDALAAGEGVLGVLGEEEGGEETFAVQIFLGGGFDLVGRDFLDAVDVLGGEVDAAGGHEVQGVTGGLLFGGLIAVDEAVGHTWASSKDVRRRRR